MHSACAFVVSVITETANALAVRLCDARTASVLVVSVIAGATRVRTAYVIIYTKTASMRTASVITKTARTLVASVITKTASTRAFLPLTTEAARALAASVITEAAHALAAFAITETAIALAVSVIAGARYGFVRVGVVGLVFLWGF